MRMYVLLGAAIIAVGLSAAALAAPPASTKHFSDVVKNTASEKFTTGTVKTYDAGTRMLNLTAGDMFKLAPAVAAPAVGKKVTVRWKSDHGQRIADEVKAD